VSFSGSAAIFFADPVARQPVHRVLPSVQSMYSGGMLYKIYGHLKGGCRAHTLNQTCLFSDHLLRPRIASAKRNRTGGVVLHLRQGCDS
jgi:hypothetical protein